MVIGILIALALNNLHQTRQNEQHITTILNQIQKELSVDILDAIRIADTYKLVDSLSRRILMDSVAVDEFASNPIYNSLSKSYVSFSTNKSGYNQLMNNLQILPEKFKPLLLDFNLLYIEFQDDIDGFNNKLRIDAEKENQKLLDKAKEAYSWFIGGSNKSKEEANYFLNDPFYKNQVLDYVRNFESVVSGSSAYRAVAVNVYKRIDSLLNTKKENIPDHLKIVDNISGELNTYLGEYSDEFGTLTISKKEEQLFLALAFQDEQAQSFPLWRHNNDTYFVNFNGTIRFITFSKVNGVPRINFNHFSNIDNIPLIKVMNN